MSSRYVQITPWALLEYEYANQAIPVNATQVLRITNNHTNSYQYINGNIALNKTGNVLTLFNLSPSTSQISNSNSLFNEPKKIYLIVANKI
jgi:hypothetical protein